MCRLNCDHKEVLKPAFLGPGVHTAFPKPSKYFGQMQNYKWCLSDRALKCCSSRAEGLVVEHRHAGAAGWEVAQLPRNSLGICWKVDDISKLR